MGVQDRLVVLHEEIDTLCLGEFRVTQELCLVVDCVLRRENPFSIGRSQTRPLLGGLARTLEAMEWLLLLL